MNERPHWPTALGTWLLALLWVTPLLFAALGGLMSERSGVINIGLEGMMLMGAFFGVWGADITGSWVLGLLIAMASGMALALIHAVFAITLRADQIVSGVGINLAAIGLTSYLFDQIFGNLQQIVVPTIPSFSIPLRSSP